MALSEGGMPSGLPARRRRYFNLFRTSRAAQFLAHDTKSIRQWEIPALSARPVLGIIERLWRTRPLVAVLSVCGYWCGIRPNEDFFEAIQPNQQPAAQ